MGLMGQHESYWVNKLASNNMATDASDFLTSIAD